MRHESPAPLAGRPLQCPDHGTGAIGEALMLLLSQGGGTDARGEEREEDDGGRSGEQRRGGTHARRTGKGIVLMDCNLEITCCT